MKECPLRLPERKVFRDQKEGENSWSVVITERVTEEEASGSLTMWSLISHSKDLSFHSE